MTNQTQEATTEVEQADWLAILMGSFEETEELQRQDKINLKKAQTKLAKLQTKLQTWEAKSYKANDIVWTNRDEEPVATYGKINERRKARTIRNIKSDIKEVEFQIEGLTPINER